MPTPKPLSGPWATLLRVAWLAIVLGLLLQLALLLVATGFGAAAGSRALLAETLRTVSWSLLVCVGVALGRVAAKGRLPLEGITSLLAAPLALTAANTVQKGVAEAVNAAGVPAGPAPLWVLAIKAAEYGCLGLALEWVGRRAWGSALGHVAVGLLTGVIFGGLFLMVVVQSAPTPLSIPALVAKGLNELLFPVGCALVVFIAEVLRAHLEPVTAVEVGVGALEEPVLEPVRLPEPQHIACRLHGRQVGGLVGGVRYLRDDVDDRLAASPGTEVDPACSSRTTRSPSAGRLRRHRRLVQRPDRDQGPLAAVLAQQLWGSRLAARRHRPLGGHHQQCAVRQAATDQDGQRQRGRISIVQIVQDDQQRPVGGDRRQDVDDRTLQRVPGPVGLQDRRRRYLARPGQLGDQVDQPGHSGGMHPGRHIGCPGQRPQDLLPQPVWGTRACPQARPQTTIQP